MTGQTRITCTSAIETWREVIALLLGAADRGYRESETNPAAHSTALWAHGVASAAINLLPPAHDAELDVTLPDSAMGLDMGGLVRVAEIATRRHPVEQFPTGASGVIVALGDLAAAVRT